MSKISKKELQTTNGEINRVCADCKRLKGLEHFYKCEHCKGGFMKRCKICFQRWKVEVREPKPKKKRGMTNSGSMAKMTACTKQDYMEMYEFMEKLGFDPNNVHKDFCLKYGLQEKIRPAKNASIWLPNGEKNPLSYSQRGLK